MAAKSPAHRVFVVEVVFRHICISHTVVERSVTAAERHTWEVGGIRNSLEPDRIRIVLVLVERKVSICKPIETGIKAIEQLRRDRPVVVETESMRRHNLKAVIRERPAQRSCDRRTWNLS